MFSTFLTSATALRSSATFLAASDFIGAAIFTLIFLAFNFLSAFFNKSLFLIKPFSVVIITTDFFALLSIADN